MIVTFIEGKDSRGKICDKYVGYIGIPIKEDDLLHCRLFGKYTHIEWGFVKTRVIECMLEK